MQSWEIGYYKRVLPRLRNDYCEIGQFYTYTRLLLIREQRGIFNYLVKFERTPFDPTIQDMFHIIRRGRPGWINIFTLWPLMRCEEGCWEGILFILNGHEFCFFLSGGRWEVISTKIGNPLNLINLRNINIQIPQHFILYFIVKVGRNGRNGLFVRISPFYHVLQHIWGRTEASPVVGII